MSAVYGVSTMQGRYPASENIGTGWSDWSLLDPATFLWVRDSDEWPDDLFDLVAVVPQYLPDKDNLTNRGGLPGLAALYEGTLYLHAFHPDRQERVMRYWASDGYGPVKPAERAAALFLNEIWDRRVTGYEVDSFRAACLAADEMWLGGGHEGHYLVDNWDVDELPPMPDLSFDKTGGFRYHEEHGRRLYRAEGDGWTIELIGGYIGAFKESYNTRWTWQAYLTDEPFLSFGAGMTAYHHPVGSPLDESIGSIDPRDCIKSIGRRLPDLIDQANADLARTMSPDLDYVRHPRTDSLQPTWPGSADTAYQPTPSRHAR